MNLRTYLILLFCGVVASVYVPTSLQCGTSADVESITTFPFSISRPLNEYASMVSTWKGPVPALVTAYVVAGAYEATTYVQSNLVLYEANFSGTTFDKLATYNLTEATWETSATKIDSCQGFYMRTSLPNGALLEYTWYIHEEDYEFTYAGRDYTANKGDLNNYFFLSNFSYMYPNISRPAFEMYMKYPRPLQVSRADWASVLGEGRIFPQDPDAVNVTRFGISDTEPLVATPGYDVSPFNLYSRYMNYGLLNDGKMNVHFRAVGYELEDNGIVSFNLFATYLGDFTSANDSMYYLQRFGFEANITQAGSSSSSGGVSTFNFSLWYLLVGLFSIFQ
eukprot:TRINITY_DN1012_c0_g1_i1.p1 TRINITY_DN1012_c0_g1~~TRINITY_DN1012_c0_g1_i1.p1  ORF type:complete len:336 (-),score=34.64 TRINITY_DN1012_c0_g1_i1:117-1124(-)